MRYEYLEYMVEPAEPLLAWSTRMGRAKYIRKVIDLMMVAAANASACRDKMFLC